MPTKKTHEEFIKEMAVKQPNIEVLETYTGGHNKILCKCKKDGYKWVVRPSSLLSGIGCPKCAGVARRTHEEFIQEINIINSNIEIISKFKNVATKVKCKCKIDGYEWKTTPSSLLRGGGCPKCAGLAKKTHKQFIEELNQVNPNIEVLGTYKNMHIKIKCKCKIDGYEWEVDPNNLIKGHGCPVCGGKIKRTHEQFLQELQEVNQDIEVLDTYKTSQTKIKVRCKICQYEWEVRPNNLLKMNAGCPKCSITRGEKRVAQYLDNLGIQYIFNKCYFEDLRGINGGLLRPDFIIPALKLWVEYDGEQHFAPVDFTSKKTDQEVQEQFKQVQQHDQIKNQYAQDNNWTLIRIPYWDYDNIEQILDAVIKQEEAI